MDGSVPSTPPSSGKGKRRDAPSDYRGDVSRAPDSDAAARGSSGVAHLEPADETMRDRSFSESRSVSSDDADAREDVAAVAREAAVDRKVRVPFGHETSPRSIDVSRRKTKTRSGSRCFFPPTRTPFSRACHSVVGRFSDSYGNSSRRLSL
jgi:hypothetical protein